VQYLNRQRRRIKQENIWPIFVLLSVFAVNKSVDFARLQI
jgi:hypothetical protein